MGPFTVRSMPPRSGPLALALAVLVLGSAFAPLARAGFGDLVKKAKDKAAQAGANKATGKSPAASGDGDDAVEFTHVMIELSGERLDHVLAGLKAGNDVLAGRGALVAKRSGLQDQAGALANQYGPAMDAAREKHNEAEQCWREALGAKRSERERQMQQKMMSDPALREKIMSLSMAMAQAQAGGDTATVMRLQNEVLALSGPTHADTLEARAKCGPMPPLHPMEAKVEALQRDAAAIDEQIRANDQQSIDAQGKASGLEPDQFAMARERLLMWLSAIRSKGRPRGFSADERTALDAHRAEIEAALAAWAD